MRHLTLGAFRDTHDAEAVAFWIFGGIIMLIAFGEALAVLAAVVAVVAAISWLYHKVGRRFARKDEELAPVTPLRPALTGDGELRVTSGDPSRGPRAA
ncbi:hypothetical protein AWC11_25425 [Mycobacterium interjectum]|nr:hypothetical protein AWC11_25425 [Mycobacterium interjectum]